MHALRSSLIFKKKRCFLVFYILQDILNAINDDAGKGFAQRLIFNSFPIFSSLLC